MVFEWDESKRQTNLERHQVDFAIVPEFEFDHALSVLHTRAGEVRYASLGPIGGRLYCLVWTPRPPAVRVISLRKANRREIDRYRSLLD